MNNERNKKIEQILASLDGSPKAEMPPFFYTRLKARMLSGEEGKASALPQRSWLLRPAFALGTLVAVLAINAFVIFQKSDTTETSSSTDSETIQAIAAEYSLNDNSTVLFEINQDK
jgi:hypothetical protein